MYLSLMEKRAKRTRDHFATDISWRSKFARGRCEADPDYTRASLFLRAFFFVFFIKSARKLVVEPPMTVDWSLMSEL